MKISDFILCGLNGSCLPLLANTTPAPSPPSLLDDSLVIDLGYARYRGFLDSTTNISHWRGIRYAAPPVGNLYQAPQSPGNDSDVIIEATNFSSFAQCPQTGTTAADGNLVGADLGAEDCLFLTVSSPATAVDLPVFVWIHGGGFQNGNGKLDFSYMMQQSNYSFVVVTIQYRLNSFGFLSSVDVRQRGQLNAGLLDQLQALQWVQKYIHLFGGNSSHVTLGGESAGAASIYYHVRTLTFVSSPTD
jgi:carboxylesterase type B